MSEDDSIIEVVVDRGLGRDCGDRLRGLRRNDRQHRAECNGRRPIGERCRECQRQRAGVRCHRLPGHGRGPLRDRAVQAGDLKKIKRPDARTVVFDLCSSDVAFLSKIAFSSFAINDAGWLASHIDPAVTEGQKIVSEANGTGAYKLKAGTAARTSPTRHTTATGAPRP